MWRIKSRLPLAALLILESTASEVLTMPVDSSRGIGV